MAWHGSRIFGIGTHPVDAEAARRQAEREGDKHGLKNYPPIDTAGNPAMDNKGEAYKDEAITTERLLLAGHLAGQRVDDDREIATCRGETTRTTTESADLRATSEVATAELCSFGQRVPLAAKKGFWPDWLVLAILLVLGAGSAAALVAALQSVTGDAPLLSWAMGIAFAGAGLVSGAAVGALLRRRDLDTVKPGSWSATSKRWVLVVCLGMLGIASLGWAISGLRQAASEADAARLANATSITVFVPGETPTGADAGNPAVPHGVGRLVWLALEFGLGAAAMAVEYLRSDARADRLKELVRRDQRAKADWKASLTPLSSAIGRHWAAVLVRADHDGAILLAGDVQLSWAHVLVNVFRDAQGMARGVGGDPYGEPPTTVPSELAAAWPSLIGQDLAGALTSVPHEESRGVNGRPDQAADLRVDLDILEAARTELKTVPSRPNTVDVTYTPGRDLGLDPHVLALDKVVAGEIEPDIDRHQPSLFDDPSYSVPSTNGSHS